MLEVLKSPHEPKYSLFIPFTRERMVEYFLESIDQLAMPLGSMEFVFYNDTDNGTLQDILYEYLNNKKDKLNGAKLYMSGNLAQSEIDTDLRRVRIVEMKRRSRELIDNSAYTICIEDDTFIQDPAAVAKLIKYIDGQENVGFVSGIERGRWGLPILGAWKMDNVYDPQHVRTLPYKKQGLEPVDGAGWYFYITPTHLYKTADYRTDGECLGPDVCYVMDLRRMHYDCYVDWSLVCGHLNNTIMLWPDENCIEVGWHKSANGWVIGG